MLLLLLGWIASPAQAQRIDELVLPGAPDLAAAQAAPASAWRQVTPQNHGYGFGERTIWRRIGFPALTEAHVVKVDNPLLTDVRFYLFDGESASGAPTQTIITGSAQPFDSRPLQADPDFALRVEASSRPRVLLIGAASNGTLRVQPFVYTAHHYAEHQWGVMLVRGAYYGAIALMALYNFALAIGLRNRIYGFYVGYALSVLLLAGALDGTLQQLLRGSAGGWLAPTMMIGACAGIGFLAIFARDFLRSRSGSLQHRALSFLAIGAFALPLLLLTELGHFPYLALLVFGLAAELTFIVVSLSQWRGGELDVRIYIIAILCVALASIAYAGMQYGVLPNVLLTRHAMQIGTTIEVVMLSFALATRIKLERQASERLQAGATALTVRLEAIQRERELAAKEVALQESVWRSRQLQVLGQMAGGFAHGFNNILTSMMGFAELAAERASEARDDVQRRHLSEIQNGGRRAAQLVDQLLTYSGGNRRLPSNVDLVEVIDRAVSLLRAALPAQIRLAWNAPSRPAVTRVDPDRMQQAIVNLCFNARDAIGDRGLVEVELANRRLDEFTCSSCATVASGAHYVLTVRDDGPGISGDIAQIFVPFYTTRPADASGLGLSIVHAVVHECGGHLQARNLPDGGSEFSLYIPV